MSQHLIKEIQQLKREVALLKEAPIAQTPAQIPGSTPENQGQTAAAAGATDPLTALEEEVWTMWAHIKKNTKEIEALKMR